MNIFDTNFIFDFSIFSLESIFFFSNSRNCSKVCYANSYKTMVHENDDDDTFPIKERTLESHFSSISSEFSKIHPFQNLTTLFSISDLPIYTKCLYLRLQKYLSTMPSDIAMPSSSVHTEYRKWLNSIYMPYEFYPLFLGLFSVPITRLCNWRKYKENTVKSSIDSIYDFTILFNETFPLSDECRKNLYTYWLNIVFPDEMYDLLKTIDKYIKKNRSFSSKDYICENLLHLTDKIRNTYFISLSLQTDFYSEFAPCLTEFIDTGNFHFRSYLGGIDIGDFYSSLLEKYENIEKSQYESFQKTPFYNMKIDELLSLLSPYLSKSTK